MIKSKCNEVALEENIINNLKKYKKEKSYYRGCLIGGAVGDALGWPVEFLSLDKIKAIYGEVGIATLSQNTKGVFEITDDTQMTIFTAEGIINSLLSTEGNRDTLLIDEIHKAYLTWGYTQNVIEKERIDITSYLLQYPALLEQRAPGRTCMQSLQSNIMPTIKNPINDSKGCGAVMRMAPIGLAYTKEKAFEYGCDCGVITHGHPSGYISAGILACIISAIIEGMELLDAINYSLKEAKKYSESEECIEIINRAINLAKSDIKPEDAIRKLGEGWVGEEAIAIAIYCSLKYRNSFEDALIASVNHDGDSDSTGAITGNILGAYLGIDKIPSKWVEYLELKELLVEIADKLLET